MGMMYGRLVCVLWLSLVVGCSTRPATERDDETVSALDSLRDRLDEAEASQVDDNEALFELGEGEEPSEVEQTSSIPEFAALHIPAPRYFGALPDGDPLVLGVFPLRARRDPIVDGDTVAVDGLDASLRLLGLDTEEIWHHGRDLRPRAYSDFQGYLEIIYADGGFPKFGTPMGEAAREWARRFFSGDTEVRLEFDELGRTRGYFNRYLVYVFAERDGQWVNYNVEAVRAGMSPYFPKYGYSIRFHDEFVEAQAEARAAQRGLWSPDARAYPDYDGRLPWWERRAQQIEHFRANYGDNPNYVMIGDAGHWARLPGLAGQEIVVFGTLGDFHYDYDPQRVHMSHQITNDFTLVSFREGVLESLNLERFRGEFVYARGRLNFFRDRPQFIVDREFEMWIEP